jgi:hypothetical protein
MLIASCYKTWDENGNLVWKFFMTLDGRKEFSEIMS